MCYQMNIETLFLVNEKRKTAENTLTKPELLLLLFKLFTAGRKCLVER